MLDYSLPIARRTRQRQEQVYREFYEELQKRKKKKRDSEVDSCTARVPNASSGDELLKNVNGVDGSRHCSRDSTQDNVEETRVYKRRRKRDYPLDFVSSESSRAKDVQKSEIGEKDDDEEEEEDLIEVESSSDEVVPNENKVGVDYAHFKCSISQSASTAKCDGYRSSNVDGEVISKNRSNLNHLDSGKCSEYFSVDGDDEVVSGNCSVFNFEKPDDYVSMDPVDEVVSGNVDIHNKAEESEETELSSTESEAEDMSDEDYEVAESENSAGSDSSESSLSSYEEEGRNKSVKCDEKIRSFGEAEKGEKFGDRVKMDKSNGFDRLVDRGSDELDDSKNRENEVEIDSKVKSWANTSCPNFSSTFEKKCMEFETFGNPFRVSEGVDLGEDDDFDGNEIDDSVKNTHPSEKKSDLNQVKACYDRWESKTKDNNPCNFPHNGWQENNVYPSKSSHDKFESRTNDATVRGNLEKGGRDSFNGFALRNYGRIDLETYQSHLKACSGRRESGTNDSNEFDEQQNSRQENDDCLWKGSNNASFCGISEKMGRDRSEGFTSMNRKGANTKFDIYRVLVDSIFHNEAIRLEEKVLSTDQVCYEFGRTSGSLPLKFKFGVEESIVPDKSEEELELDKLWAELEFGLRCCEMGFVESYMQAEIPDVPPSHCGVDRSTFCFQGVHQLILDQEVGLRCMVCSYVQLEIKYIMPSFDPYPFGKPSRRYYGPVDGFTFSDIRKDDSGGDFHAQSNPYDHCDGTVWDIIPGIKKSMYPHQCEGFEFIWKNIAGGIHLDKLRNGEISSETGGCIISHAPGTGKTRLTIVFLQSYMELYPNCRPVIIAPKSMLLTWEEEFEKWKVGVPFHNLNKTEFSGKENWAALSPLIQAPQVCQNIEFVRLVKLYSWKFEKSILGIGYRLFEQLASERVHSELDIRKMLLEFPGIVFFDEGHIPRNDSSYIWQSLMQLKTEKRIILSGTLFQNNFTEFYNTLRLARPKFAYGKDDILEKKRGQKKKISRAKWDSLTSAIGKDADDMLGRAQVREVQAMISPFVHIHKGTILQERLPGLRNSVIILKPTELQRNVLQSIQEVKNPLLLDCLESLISVHPSLYLKFKINECVVDLAALENLRLNLDSGVKIQFIIELIRLSQPLNEKVLIFSQYLDPLRFVREHLELHFNWIQGKEVLCMDGTCDIKKRQSSINIFNDPTSEARVLLASTKACSEGINLVGASRVVLIDVVWNPSVERQAISRAYRLGQEKLVYTYHLIASGTREEEKYDRQVEKDRISEIIFSSSTKNCGLPKISPSVSDDKILEAMVDNDKFKDVVLEIRCISNEVDLV